MPFTVNTAAIYPLLRPTLKGIQMIYNTGESFYDPMYKKGTSDLAWEEFTHFKPLGPARLKPEGTATYIDDLKSMWQFSASHKPFATSFTITYEAQKFNQYGREFPQQAKLLANSHMQTKNYRAIEPFINGFNPAALTYDSQPLFSLTHPTAVGTYANTIGMPTQFDEEALEDIEISLAGMTDDAGNRVLMKGNKVIISPLNRFNANRILNPNATERPGTTNRDINALNFTKSFPGGIHENIFFGNDWEDWYIQTTGGPGFDHCEGALHLVAEELRIDPFADERMKTISCISYEMYLFVIWNNRQYFGIQGLA